MGKKGLAELTAARRTIVVLNFRARNIQAVCILTIVWSGCVSGKDPNCLSGDLLQNRSGFPHGT